ncbi:MULTISPECIES: DUF1538 domain-containing protein [unclassified Halomonas]|uniref:DUF1538 domain-containing protein n=1 Tax=unclassified Halomonas TaxID=2609666 RepID=UPI0021E4CF60|nr:MULTISPECIES: DUF1538 domain-containing protein [unclassified Halomonas]UYG01547.1 DUF1538 domain-containing protein [Halomonas sp. GD1P12]WNL37397.1 DUF1538 domain-containing protein [Halomonas sp. PAMB 3232]
MLFALSMLHQLKNSLRDLTPIVLVMGFFQLVVIRQPLPDTLALADLAFGILCVLLGLTLFIKGLELGLFPLGERLAHAFVTKGSLFWLLLFAFALGFGSTVAEPALIAVAARAGQVLFDGGLIEQTSQARFALTLRMVVALSVGAAVVLGVMRIIKGWPLPPLIVGGYVLVLMLTLFAPTELVGIAFDSGGVTTSTITVPLVTALGVGLASSIKGRNPMLDGFGLIALASIMPIIFVLAFGILGPGALTGGGL